ncbi:MAG: hypothetical protein ACOYY2_02915 [Actinomycetota bacterium]
MNSVYEIDGERIRRLSGATAPTPRQGDDGVWLRAAQIGDVVVGQPVLILWDAEHGHATLTSPVTAIEETPVSVTLTLTEALAGLDALTREHPDRVYTPEPRRRPAYFHGTEPGCLIGHLLAGYGLRPADLQGAAAGRDSSGRVLADLNEATGVETLYRAGVLQATAEVVILLTRVQDEQDRGTPWRQAFARGLAEAMDEWNYRAADLAPYADLLDEQ